MDRYSELERLLGLLASQDAPSPLAVIAAADQLSGAAAEYPRDLVRRAHALVGVAAVRCATEPSEDAELGFEVACRATSAIVSAASVVDGIAEPVNEH